MGSYCDYRDEEYDPIANGFRIGPRLFAQYADTTIEPLPEKNGEHQWHFPRLTAEQLDEHLFDARQAVVSRDGALMEMARVQRDNERLRALVKQAETARDGECAWCGAERHVRVGKEPHGSAYARRPCPAFTPDGEVR